jgi:ABC-type bacteriocin/lantibiotic exporter with double-glycine peptidase domain
VESIRNPQSAIDMMPNARTQRLIGWLVFVGVLATFLGCGLIWQNQMTAAVIALVFAELIILPTFFYLLTTRRRLKKIVRRKEEEQLDALAGVGDIISTPSSDEEPG